MNQKLDNLLELSLDLSENLREKSENLSAGYDSEADTWQVIVRHSGNMEEMAEGVGRITPLYGGYAIAEVSERELERLSQMPQVEFIEKPKALSFAVYEGKLASCIPPVQNSPRSLTGRGVLVAVVDTGIDIFHPDFRNEDGTTRLVGLWDQTVKTGQPPEGYSLGTYFSEEQINEILRAGSASSTSDLNGHGTHVAGIAAGNGRASQGINRGIAYEADLLVVKLAGAGRNGFPQTAELMMGVDFCVRISLERNEPLALNLSYGNNYGSHRGTSLLETYLDSVAGIGRSVICIGSGNEGNRARHARIRLSESEGYRLEFLVAPGEYNLGIQIWKNYNDRMIITLQSPSGASVILSESALGAYRYVIEGTEILWLFGTPSPYSLAQEIYVELLPEGLRENIQSGVWKLIFTPVEIVEGVADIWLPSGSSINSDTGFLVPDQERTLTIPSTSAKPVTVGAYDSRTESFAPFSGRGFVCCDRVKPDLAAPGVEILSCAPGGGYTVKTGTSMACPFVTGSAALLMEYGIIRGRDPYLFGQKVKAYLIRGARPLAAFCDYPNDSIGWGALCLDESLPE